MSRPKLRDVAWKKISAEISPDSRDRLDMARAVAGRGTSLGGIIDALIQAYIPAVVGNPPRLSRPWSLPGRDAAVADTPGLPDPSGIAAQPDVAGISDSAPSPAPPPNLPHPIEQLPPAVATSIVGGPAATATNPPKAPTAKPKSNQATSSSQGSKKEPKAKNTPRLPPFPPMPDGPLDPVWVKESMKALGVRQHQIASRVGITPRGVGEWFDPGNIPNKHKITVYNILLQAHKKKTRT